MSFRNRKRKRTEVEDLRISKTTKDTEFTCVCCMSDEPVTSVACPTCEKPHCVKCIVSFYLAKTERTYHNDILYLVTPKYVQCTHCRSNMGGSLVCLMDEFTTPSTEHGRRPPRLGCLFSDNCIGCGTTTDPNEAVDRAFDCHCAKLPCVLCGQEVELGTSIRMFFSMWNQCLPGLSRRRTGQLSAAVRSLVPCTYTSHLQFDCKGFGCKYSSIESGLSYGEALRRRTWFSTIGDMVRMSQRLEQLYPAFSFPEGMDIVRSVRAQMEGIQAIGLPLRASMTVTEPNVVHMGRVHQMTIRATVVGDERHVHRAIEQIARAAEEVDAQ